MTKLSKSKFKGQLNEACHQFTLGKHTEDVKACIDILENKLDDLKEFLYKRETKKEVKRKSDPCYY